MTPEEFAELFGVLMAAYPQREISGTTIAVYTRRFASMDPRLFGAAVEECIETHDWFPSVRQFKAAAARVLTRAGILPPGAEDAWSAVMDVARTWRDGAPIGPRLADEVKAALSAAGGIRAVATASSEWEVSRIEGRFTTAYEQYRAALVAVALQERYTEAHGLKGGARVIGTPRSGARAIPERGYDAPH